MLMQCRARGDVVGLEGRPLIDSSMAFSIISINRRTFRYRQSGSLESVRAPNMRMPRAGNARSALTCSG